MKSKNIGSCRILKKISDNAYVLEFPECVDISLKFNVFDLQNFEEGLKSDGKDIVKFLRQMSFQLREEVIEMFGEKEFIRNMSQNKK